MPDKCVDIVLTDPPYMEDIEEYKGMQKRLHGVTEAGQYANTKYFKKPDPIYFDEIFRISKNQIIFGVNHYEQYWGSGLIIWDKNVHGQYNHAELAYQSLSNSVRIFHYTWSGMLQENMKDKEKRFHPTQKPIALFQWILQKYSSPGTTIFDPFAGSGTTAIACLETGRNYILIEKEPDYVEIINKRIATWKEQGRMFA
jgi:site-specific DNA-methyltransferase (adenine-specific)